MTESLLDGLATEDTQSLVLDALQNPAPLKFDQSKLTPSGALRVGTSLSKFRDDFLTFDTVNNWTVISDGGMTYGVNGLIGGSRYLNIAAGITPNTEFIMLSKMTFKCPLKFVFAHSQLIRQLNQEVFIELVEVSDAGEQVTDATVFTAPTVNNSKNAVGILFDGTVVTNAKYTVRGEGISELVSGAVTTLTSLATGTDPNFSPAAQTEILLQTDILSIGSRAVNSTAAATAMVNRTDYVPDSDKNYAIRIRVKNGVSAPAAANNIRIHFIRIIDATRLSVDFGTIGGNPTDMLAAPVKVIGGVGTTAVTTTLTSAAPTVYADSTANLAIGATFTGTSRDSGSTNTMRRYTANFAGSQASADNGCKIQHSVDGTTWYDAAIGTKEVGKPLQLSTDVISRYCRAVMTNGTVSQTGMGIHSAYHKV